MQQSGAPSKSSQDAQARELAERARRAHVYRRCRAHFLGGLTLIAGLASVRGYGPRHLALMGFGLVLSVAANAAMGSVRLPREHARRWFVVLALGLGISVWAALPAAPTTATDQASELQTALIQQAKKAERAAARAHPVSNGITVGEPIAVGGHPTAIVVADDGPWTITTTSLTHLDALPRPAAAGTVTFRMPYDIAAAGVVLATVRAGWVYFFDVSHRAWIKPAYHFSEKRGHVATCFRSAWLLNEAHSKLDRISLRTHRREYAPIDVPGVPKVILCTPTSIWVATENGWVVRYDPRTNREVKRVAIDVSPTALVDVDREILVADAESGELTRIDAIRTEVVGRLIPVTQDVRALVRAGGYVWALGGFGHVVQRIDARLGRIVAREPLPRDGVPEDMVAAGRRLYITSSNGTVVPVDFAPVAAPWSWRTASAP